MFDKIINKFRKNDSEEGPFDRQNLSLTINELYYAIGLRPDDFIYEVVEPKENHEPQDYNWHEHEVTVRDIRSGFWFQVILRFETYYDECHVIDAAIDLEELSIDDIKCIEYIYKILRNYWKEKYQEISEKESKNYKWFEKIFEENIKYEDQLKFDNI